MLSASFLLIFTDEIYAGRGDTMTLSEFYDRFNNTHQSPRFRPFNHGVILGYLYWIMYAKENWEGLVPNDDPSSWGIAPIQLSFPKHPRPSLKQLVRRIRNSLGHAIPEFSVAPGTNTDTMLEGVTITFHDKNRHDASDTFDAELTLKDAFELAKKLQGLVHKDVAQRHGVAAPTK